MKNLLLKSSLIALFLFVSAGFCETALTDGQPVDYADLPMHGYAHYTFQIPNDAHTDVTFSVISTTGDADLYLDTRGFPNTTVHQWASRKSGGDLINIKHSDKDFCEAPCTWYISVFAFTETSFTIVASSSSVTTKIRPGIPTHDVSDAPEEYEYFSVLLNRQNVNVTISVTTFSGDTNFFVSKVAERPNATFNTWKEEGAGNDTLVIAWDDPNFQPCNDTCTLYISVYSLEPSEFSILVGYQSVPSFLVDGVQQNGVTDSGQFTFYKSVVNKLPGDFEVALVPWWGNVDLYIRRDQLPSLDCTSDNQCWKSTNNGADYITIVHTDPNFCDTCTYYIGVYSEMHSHFMVTARTTNTTNLLITGVPFTQSLPEGDWTYFRYQNMRDDVNITLQATVSTGDIDIYVALDPVTQPSADTALWHLVGASMLTVEDLTLTIGLDDANYCTPPCMYYIGLRAVKTSEYSLVVSTEIVPTRMVIGKTLSGVVRYRDWIYYSLEVGTVHRDVSFFVTRKYGDPDLYVSTARKPDLDHYMLRSMNQGSDSLIIRRNDTEYFSENCIYYVGVFGYDFSGYDILASVDDAIVELALGKAQTEEIDEAGGYEYFKVDFTSTIMNQNNITLQVTSLSGGSAELFASTSNSMPNSSIYTWTGTETIYIPYNDPSSCEGQCFLYISVKAPASSFHYTILASIESMPSLLIPGVPQEGMIKENEYNHYRFWISEPHSSVIIQMTKSSGDPDLYAATDVIKPTKESHMWHSYRSGSDYLRLDSHSHPELGCYNCWVYIGVYGYNAWHSHYTIVASMTNDTITLPLGTALRDEIVHAGHEADYMVEYPGGKANITFDVTMMLGSVDMYISTVSPAGPQNFDWSAMGPGDTSIVVNYEDGKLCSSACNLYITLIAREACSYTILASIGLVTLQDGTPQSGSVAKFKYKYYQFNVGDIDDHVDITFSLNTRSGNADLLINKETDGLPTIGGWTWQSLNYGSDTISISSGDSHRCTKCIYYIGVYGRTFFTDDSSFDIIVSSNHRYFLQESLAIVESTSVGAYDYFLYNVVERSSRNDLVVVATPLSGDVQIYMSPSVDCQSTCAQYTDYNATDTPTVNYHKWSGKHQIIVPKADVCGDCVFAIGVLGTGTAGGTVGFSIVAEDSGYVSLTSGLPQSGSVSHSANEFYKFYSTVTDGFVISLTSTSGLGYLYVSTTNTLPSSGDSTWKSESSELSTSLHISNADSDFCSNCYYYIGVTGQHLGTNSFSIEITDGSKYSMLIDGVKTSAVDDLSPDGYARYEGYSSVDSGTILMEVEVCTGTKAELYASSTNMEPTSAVGDYTWKGTDNERSSIELSSTQVKKGSYYMAIQPVGGYTGTFAYDVLFSTGGTSRPKLGTSTISKVDSDSVSVKIQWKEALPTGSAALITYTVYVAEDAGENDGKALHTVCGCEKHGKVVASTSELQATITGLSNNTSYMINVVASDDSAKTLNKIAYSMIIVTTPKGEDDDAGWLAKNGWIWALVGCAVILPVGLGLYRKKTRKNRAQIELLETGEEQPHFGKKTNTGYSKLEGDDVETGDYAPPPVLDSGSRV